MEYMEYMETVNVPLKRILMKYYGNARYKLKRNIVFNDDDKNSPNKIISLT